MHKTAAWPLAVLYSGLIVYASLYPFADWRNQDIAPWFFLLAPPAYYWTGFDVAMNVVGYVPMGGLLALSGLRTQWLKHPVWVALVACAVLSMGMEILQSYLPVRVPSREDFMLNFLGAVVGAVLTLRLERWGAIDRWSRIRARWFVPHARGGIVLLVTWPLALLFPPAVPFGLGQVLERLEDFLASYLDGTPFLNWLPVRTVELPAMLPGAQMVCVLLGLLIPCLLGFCVVRMPWRRGFLVWMTMGVGVAVTALSASLSWGPQHAWAWLDFPTQVGMGIALALALGMAWMPWRASAAVLLLALGIYLSVLNQAPEGAYFAQTLQEWEQGRFIRFNGLAQWLGWLWPYAALVYVLALIGRRDSKN